MPIDYVYCDFFANGQVYLIDMQSQQDGTYKWILNYQDHFTKFLHLRPLERKSAADVATALLDIFLSMNGAKMCHHGDLSANVYLCKLGLFAS